MFSVHRMWMNGKAGSCHLEHHQVHKYYQVNKNKNYVDKAMCFNSYTIFQYSIPTRFYLYDYFNRIIFLEIVRSRFLKD